MSVLALNSFGNLPDGWCPHSSFYVLYVIEETALKTPTICSDLFYSKGKIIYPSGLLLVIGRSYSLQD